MSNRQFSQAMTGVTCCQPEIGMSPGGVPFTLHEQGCRGLEERLSAAVLEAPTGTEREMEAQAQRMAELSRRLYRLKKELGALAGRWRDQGRCPVSNRSVAYQMGEANAYGAAAAQLDEALALPEVT